jgi:KamA family protein
MTFDGSSVKDDRFTAISRANVARTPEWARLDPELREAVNVVSTVLPFRTNAYVMRELIDWDRVPDDPIFQLTFPQRGMLSEEDYAAISALICAQAPREAMEQEANRIRLELNPNPAGQKTHNVPKVDGRYVPGLQHKYRQTVLFFPSQGQTCHAYCTFCFRWPQFVGMNELRFSSRDIDLLVSYLANRPEVTDILFTGGDPMVMSTKILRRYLEPLLDPSLEHVQDIRIGTKSVAYWPQRFVTDADADDLIRLFEQVTNAGRHLAIMGHYSHPVELSTEVSREAVRRIQSTGAHIRQQCPVVRHINDHPDTFAELWRNSVRMGIIPYYMFVERDTGAKAYFEIPLARAWQIFRDAYQQVSGLARTVRGPSMSAFPGKVRVVGVTENLGQKVFVLEYIQARDPSLVGRPFFAKFDPKATWFDQLEPATEGDRPFFPRVAASDPKTSPAQLGSKLALATEE